MTRTIVGRTTLVRGWWIVFPSFTLLTLRFTVERACGDPYDLLPAAGSDAVRAWLLAVVYVLAHVWLVWAYSLTVSRAHRLLPSARDLTSFWGSDSLKIYLLAAALLTEHLPVSLFRLIGYGIGCSQ